MNILFYYLYGGGGALENMKVLYDALARRPSVTRLTLVCSQTSGLCELVSNPKVKLITADHLPARELNRAYMGYRGLRDVVRRERPDVVVGMNLSSYVRLPAPSVVCINNPFQVYPSGIESLHPKGGKGLAILRAFSDWSLAQTDGIICQTDLIRDYALGRAKRNIPAWTIGKSVEGDGDVVFQPLPEATRERLCQTSNICFTFLYAATLAAHKNHAVLYDTMDQLRTAGAPVRLMLTLDAGEVSATGGELGESLVASGHVIPIGFLKKAQLRAAYDAADGCVMPSVLESLSSAHLEAMAWGKPQVAADLPYARSLCGDAAVYAPPHDPGAWAGAMIAVAEDEALRSRLVESGRRTMSTMPRSVAEAANRLEQVLREVVRLSPARARFSNFDPFRPFERVSSL